MISFNKITLFFLVVINTCNIYAIIDNRYIPLYRQIFRHYTDKKSAFGANLFFVTGKSARDQAGEDVSVAELNGKYDLAIIGKSMEKAGLENPILDQLQTKPHIIFDLDGKLEAQGLWIGYEQALGKYLGLGANIYMMHVTSRQDFNISEKLIKDLNLLNGMENILRKNQGEANDLMGLKFGQFSKTGFSDLDFYFRIGNVVDYYYKFRRIDYGICFGVLVPVGPKIELDNPASIPFGGLNGLFGIYSMADFTFELKEDLVVGLWIQICQRFEKTQKSRIPVGLEPIEFAPLTGPVHVKPGITFGISPYIALEDLMNGFGVKGRYTFVLHEHDNLIDMRPDKTVPSKLRPVIDNSGWIAEYATISGLYDFSKTNKPRKFAPLVYLDWDIPVNVFGARGVAKTNRVSLGMEIDF